MTDDIFDIDGADAAYQARLKALAAKRDADRLKLRDRLGDLAIATNIANGRTPQNLVGSWLWAQQQARANPALNKEWDRLGATFLGKSRAAKPSAGNAEAAEAGNAKPTAKQEPDRDPAARPGDLLARAATE